MFCFFPLLLLFLLFLLLLFFAIPCSAAGWESIGANGLERDEPGSCRTLLIEGERARVTCVLYFFMLNHVDPYRDLDLLDLDVPSAHSNVSLFANCLGTCHKRLWHATAQSAANCAAPQCSRKGTPKRLSHHIWLHDSSQLLFGILLDSGTGWTDWTDQTAGQAVGEGALFGFPCEIIEKFDIFAGWDWLGLARYQVRSVQIKLKTRDTP